MARCWQVDLGQWCKTSTKGFKPLLTDLIIRLEVWAGNGIIKTKRPPTKVTQDRVVGCVIKLQLG